MKTQITSYINSKRNSWSATTLKSEVARLNAVAHLITGDAATLWEHLAPYKPYSRVTVYQRVTSFWGYMHPNQANPYEVWREANGNLFKNAYQPERLSFTYDEAVERINRIPNASIRQHALAILHSGQRFCESIQTGEVVMGKGGKLRPNLRGESPPPFTGPYHLFHKELAAVGLKSHSLRKLALTKAVDMGATPQDLCEIAGWASLKPAMSYLQPKRVDKLKGLLCSTS